MTLNLYTYVHNNPLRYIDPTGNYCVSANKQYAHSGTCYSDDSFYLDDNLVNGVMGQTNALGSAKDFVFTHGTRWKDYQSQSSGSTNNSATIAIPAPGTGVGAGGAVAGEIVAGLARLVLPFALLLSLSGDTAIDKSREPTYIFRSGSMSNKNLTPREQDINGLSFFLTPDPSWSSTIYTTLEEVNATGVLTAVVDNPRTGHVSLFSTDLSEMPAWIASREDANTAPHPLTILLKELVKKLPK